MKRSFFILAAFLLALIPADAGEAKVKNVSPKEAQALLAKKAPPVIIDIRTPAEFAQGHIKGAKNIDFKNPDFEKKLSKLDRNKSYVFHCKSGGRSTKSLTVWKKLEFKNLYHLDQGILGWQKAKLPVVKAKKSQP